MTAYEGKETAPYYQIWDVQHDRYNSLKLTVILKENWADSVFFPISRPTDVTCDRFLFSFYMCITLHVSSVKRSSSGVPRRTYSLQFLCLCLSAALSCKKCTVRDSWWWALDARNMESYTHIDRKLKSITSCICWSTYWNIWRCTDQETLKIGGFCFGGAAHEYVMRTWLTLCVYRIVCWCAWIRVSWYNDENNQQDALYRLIYWSKSALHVSADVSNELKLQFQLIRDTSRQQLGWTLPDTVNTFMCSWWWAKTSPETCRADLE
jgi:hypothetical protein